MNKNKKSQKDDHAVQQEQPQKIKKNFRERVKNAAKNATRTKLRVAILVIFIAAIVAAALYFLGVFTRDTNSEAAYVVAKVRSHMLLPDETPTIATIQKVDELKKENNFYANAKNGDRLLVFTNARLAIIYSGDTDKIINVGPILTKSSEPTGK